MPLSMVVSVIMTQIVSTLASLLQGAWHPRHTPTSQSALYPLLTDYMFLLVLQQELVSLFAPDLATFLAVFSPLMQHCQQEAASTKLVSSKLQSLLLSLSKLVDMDAKTSSGSRPVADLLVSSEHWLADPGWWGRGRQPLLPGPLPLPCPPPGEDPAMADQFLKGVTMGSGGHQRVAAPAGALQAAACWWPPLPGTLPSSPP